MTLMVRVLEQAEVEKIEATPVVYSVPRTVHVLQ